MKKKLLLAFFVMMLSVIALGVVNASAATYGDLGELTYTVSEGEVAITFCSRSVNGEIVIPNEIKGYPVTAIGDRAFYGCRLTSIIIPNSVTTIGSYAFYDCRSLTSITIPDSVTSIGDDAFYNCSSLTKVNILDVAAWCNIEFGEPYANPLYYAENLYLNGNPVTQLEIPDRVTSIKSYAFYNCSRLTSITIPDSVTSIGDYAFEFCRSLTSITIGGGVTSIGESAFSGCERLESITILDSVTSIGDYAFYGCESLTSITIPGSVTSIGQGVFFRCYSLENIIVDNNNSSYSSIDGVLFNRNKTVLVRYPEGRTDIEYVVPDSVTSIGESAFIECDSLTSITIGGGVTSIGESAFSGCERLESISIPDRVTSIGKSAFRDCGSLKSISIPDSVTSIGWCAFYYCSSLATVYYNGTQEEFDNIDIGSHNDYLKNAEKKFFRYVTIIGENGERLSKKMYDVNTLIDISDIEEKFEHTIHLYTDSGYNNEYTLTTPISENIVLYLHCVPNQYPSKFVDYNGDVIQEYLLDYGAVITLPESPTRERTQQYTYTFAGWEGFEEGVTQTNHEMVFTATYIATVNKYTYKFINEDGSVLKEKTVDYGTTIELPAYIPKANTQQYTYTFLGWNGYSEGMTITDDIIFTPRYQETINQYTYKFVDEDGTVLKETTADYGERIVPANNPGDKDPYTFDYWQGYTDGIVVTDDITFKAVYKYKGYTITAEGLRDVISVTYNDDFIINPQTKDGYYFIGYFTEKDGKGIQITNEKGESLAIYNVVGNLKVYPYFESVYMNKVELSGTASATLGDTITQKAIFATDKEAAYFVATVKYPKYLNFKSIKGIDFKEAAKDSEKVVGDYKYLDITCVFDYQGNFVKTNTNYIPFEIEFEVATDAQLGSAKISMENVMLIGDDYYDITDTKNYTLTILPKLAERVVIEGSAEIDAATKFNAVVLPDYTTDKSVVWSVDDETVATITEDGMLTPVKNGTVVITASAQDGSGVFAQKTVNVIAYAKINSLDFGDGVALPEFNPDVRQYTVYVEGDATSISLTPTFSGGGVLRPNGSGVWVSGRAKEFELTGEKTIITLNRENVTGMTNSVYTIEVIRLKETEIDVSADGKSFTIIPVNVEAGKTVVLALYNGEKFVEMHSEVYAGKPIPFITDRAYTDAKVMVWDDLTTLKPICDAVELN